VGPLDRDRLDDRASLYVSRSQRWEHLGISCSRERGRHAMPSVRCWWRVRRLMRALVRTSERTWCCCRRTDAGDVSIRRPHSTCLAIPIPISRSTQLLEWVERRSFIGNQRTATCSLDWIPVDPVGAFATPRKRRYGVIWSQFSARLCSIQTIQRVTF